MPLTEQVAEPALTCPDCGGESFPEQDGECTYYSCSACEYEFGYVLTRQEAGACSLGVPEGVRQQFQAPPQLSGSPVFLGGSIGRRPQ